MRMNKLIYVKHLEQRQTMLVIVTYSLLLAWKCKWGQRRVEGVDKRETTVILETSPL